eukprot:Skav222263  [mRNA]  locus=scaffold8018:22369:23649:- [translate_table: standard]
MSDKDLCDWVAVVGPEGQRVPFNRAHLATLSKKLRAALYDELQEGQAHELSLTDLTPEAFDVMIRTAYHLDPELTPKRALHALNAAKLYMIYDLEAYCWHYLQDLEGLDCTLILQALTESHKLSFMLPEGLQHTYWSNMLAKSSDVVQSPFFIETHGAIIARLIKLDEFAIEEGTFWDRLVEWSASAVQKPELLGPFAAATPSQAPAKRMKTGADDASTTMGASEMAQQEAVLRLISPHMRFIHMKKETFIDKVRRHLSREEIDAVTDFFLLGRQSQGLLTKERMGLDLEDDQAVLLPYKEVCGYRQRRLKLSTPTLVSKVQLVYRCPSQDVPHWFVSVGKMTFGSPKNVKLATTGWSMSTVEVSLQDPCDELQIQISRTTSIDQVEKTLVFGTKFKPAVELADQVVQRLSKDLLLTSETGKDKEQ